MIIPPSFISYDFINGLKESQMFFDFFRDAKTVKNDYYNYMLFRNCSSPLIQDCIKKIVTEYYEEGIYFEEAVKCHLKLFFIGLCRSYFCSENKKYKLSHSSIDMSKISQYVYEHIEHISLYELSNVFSFNMSYLSRAIREYFGKTFQELVKEYRFEKIISLLQNSELSIEAIAEQVGYKNANVVYKAVRGKYGVTPSQYRSECKMSNVNSNQVK